jgi:4'-phosphopantetheinyl transferase
VTPAVSSEPVELTAQQPGVWLLDVTATWFAGLAETGVTSEAEQARAGVAKDPEMGRRMLSRRAALRLVLGRQLGSAPEDVRIVTAPGGKPVLLPGPAHGPSLAFSVAHSGDLYGIAVAPVASLGFDVERVRAVPRAQAIAERWFGSEEARTLDGLDDEARTAAFLRMWTGKEALAKRHGAGLRLMRGSDVQELDLASAEASGRLRFPPVSEGYVGALASTAPIERIAVFQPESDPWTT